MSDAIIKLNESIIRKGVRFNTELAQRLLPHPSIGCMWNLKEGQAPINGSHQSHGQKLAVWREDMAIPLCKHCMVEDPYE